MSIVNLTEAPAAPRQKIVPSLYETDTDKYADPHRWQIQPWAKLVRRAWRYRAYTRWTEAACERIDVAGLEHLNGINGPCVFVANHQSHLDTLITQAGLPESVKRKLFYGAAQDRWFVKGKKKLVLKPWYQSLALGTFPIMRGGGKDALSYAHWLLQKNQHVFLFPEGTRATGEELGAFKHGATLLAIENGVPIVPIYLGGLQKMRPKGTKDVVRGVASLEVLPPIEFSTGSDVAAATETIRRRLNRVHLRHRQEKIFREAA